MKLEFKNAANLPQRWLLPTQSMSLNRALGGGLESGRFHTFWGPKGSTKSTTALWSIAWAQRHDKVCAYIDAEKSLKEEYAQKCGVDLDKLLYIDEGANIAEDLLTLVLPKLDKQNIDVLVIDSLSTVLQNSFFEKPESNPMGVYSRSAKFVLIKLLNALNREMQVILISHASMDLSGYKPMLSAQMGTAQGHIVSNIIKFNALMGKDNFREGGFRKITWRIEKAKQPVWPLDGEYWFNGMTAQVDNVKEIIDIAVELNIVEKVGAWFKYGDEYKWHGLDNALDACKNDENLFNTISMDVGAHDIINRDMAASELDTNMELV